MTNELSWKLLSNAIVLILLLSEINVISSICFSAPRLSSAATLSTSSEISNSRIQDTICSKILQIGESIEELKSILTITSDDIMNDNEESEGKSVSKKAQEPPPPSISGENLVMYFWFGKGYLFSPLFCNYSGTNRNDENFLSITAKAVRPHQFVQLTYFESMKGVFKKAQDCIKCKHA